MMKKGVNTATADMSKYALNRTAEKEISGVRYKVNCFVDTESIATLGDIADRLLTDEVKKSLQKSES